MTENKTKATKANVQNYLAAIEDEARRKDCLALTLLMSRATKRRPAVWGAGNVGFGSYHYKYESGREGNVCLVGFSSRKGHVSFYGLTAAAGAAGLLTKLGKHKAGKGCVYIRSLAKVDRNVLEKLVASAAAANRYQNQ